MSFRAAAGFAPDLDALATFAGSDSALAVYDIGHLEFVYISRLPAAQLAENSLTRVRAGYQAHAAAGQTYFARQDGARIAAFATKGDLMVVSTREDLMVRTLQLMNSEAGESSVSQDQWYDDAIRAMGDEGRNPVAFRLVMDLPNVMRTPYFRSYWIQDNAAEYRVYSAFLSQITRSAGP